MTLDVEFRAEPADSEAALYLLDRYEAYLGSIGIELDHGDGGGVEASELVDPHGAFIAGYLDEQPVACGGVRRLDASVGEIKRVFVEADLRGHGLGSRLMVRLEDEARRLGLAVLRLDTGDGMDHALALYRSCGYRPIDAYNSNPHARHWFEKALG